MGRLLDALKQIEGAYALGALTRKRLVGIRDPLGIRPLIIGKLGNATILASETCALDIIGARFVREVENGEVVVISDDGIESHRAFPRCQPRPCIFEYIYFARPDLIMGGHCVMTSAKRLGANWRTRRQPMPMWSSRFPIRCARRHWLCPRIRPSL